MAGGRRVLIAATIVGGASWGGIHVTSRTVRAWRRPRRRHVRVGRLSVSDSGTGGDVVLMLHGLGATGDYFGSLYDDLGGHHRLVIPDLLGFGRSIDVEGVDFGPAAHLDALDEMLGQLELARARVTVVAHSMASALALLWAQRHPGRTLGIVLFGPPAYRTPDDARRAVGAAGPMARLFLLDTGWARALCRLSCSSRSLSGAAMTMASPRLPVAITSQASRHTWEAYRQSIDGLVLDADWPSLLASNVPVAVVRGSNDRIGDSSYLAELASTHTVLHEVAGADHHVPITCAPLGRRIIESMLHTR